MDEEGSGLLRDRAHAGLTALEVNVLPIDLRALLFAPFLSGRTGLLIRFRNTDFGSNAFL
jgi:hypothetical protein